MLSKFVIFSVLVGLVGLVLIVVGLALPPYLGVGRSVPNPLQLPFLVGGSVILIGLAFQLFKRQSAKE
ncbi:MAG: hypothetical protein AUJ07_10865 [Crenarchaeota archaeon 13_1_40CM_3_53_5]|nr:MAG: hypothetical protein AUJ07_10865 [Crenarchaeota archaeon 13_1_40CM_3_53_5]